MTPTQPIYLDWQFWSALVALAALVLSQLPPIIPRLFSGKLEVQVYGRLVLDHFLGNPTAQLLIAVENVGGRRIKVRGISLKLRRGNETFALQGQNYLETEASTTTVLLAPFKLLTKQEWKHIVNFNADLAMAEDKATKALISTVKSDLRQRRDSRTPAELESNALVDAAPALTAEAMATFGRRFKWEPGEYELDLVIDAEPFASSYSGPFRFTLWESDSSDLKAQTRNYSKGFGVCLPIEEHGVLVSICSRS